MMSTVTRRMMRALALTGLIGLSAAVLTGCANTSDQSKVYWKEIDSRKIVALDSTQSLFLTGGRHTIDGKSQVDYRFAQKTKDGAIREDLVSSLMDRTMDYSNAESYVVDVYEDAEPKSAELSIYSCTEKKAKNDSEAVSRMFSFSYNACATEDGERIEYLVRLHVPKGTVDRSFGSETRSDSEDGSGSEGNG